MNTFAVVDDAIVDDAVVVAARSFGKYSFLLIVQNMTVVYEVIARIVKINPLFGVVLNRAAPDAHIR